MSRTRVGWSLGALVGLAVLVSQASANLLANPGFEQPITMDGPPFVGFWEAFSAGAGATASNSMVMPRTGAQHADVSIVNVNNSFAGVFQDVPITGGSLGIFSGWHKANTIPLDVGVEIRIEWRNATMEVGRTPNLTVPPLPGQYSPFILPALSPAGATIARVVYAIQTFGPEPTNTGTVFLDDMSFVVPEPATFVLLASVFGFAGVRRRRPAGGVR